MNRNNNTRLFRSIMSSRDDGRRRIGFLQLCLYRAYSDWRAILFEEWPMDGPRKSPRAATDPFQALPSGCDFATRPTALQWSWALEPDISNGGIRQLRRRSKESERGLSE